MIKCNLAVILAERGMKMSDIIEKTGIAKATIRALYHNSGKGVQFETMDTLCEFLGITPGELFSRYNFNIKLIEANPSTTRDFFFFKCAFKIDGVHFEGTIGCEWKSEKEIFRIVIWHKLINKLTGIPQQHLAKIMLDFFEVANKSSITPAKTEFAIFDTEEDNWMFNYLSE